MHMLLTVSLVCGWLLLSGPSLAEAQVATRTQPILLSEAACSASPARIPTVSPPLEYRGTSYLTPSVAESMPTVMYAPVATASTPFAPSALSSEVSSIRSPSPVVEYRFYAPLSETTTTTPTSQFAPTTSLPRDYVVGRNIMGETKLFRSGQPVRNFLRYLSL